MTIGPLVCFCFDNNEQTKNSLTLCNVFFLTFLFDSMFLLLLWSKHYSFK